jgi:hypothetical protein
MGVGIREIGVVCHEQMGSSQTWEKPGLDTPEQNPKVLLLVNEEPWGVQDHHPPSGPE